jgi:hypothetical protein
MTPAARLRADDGAVLIHIAILLTALIAVTAFAADYGMLWVSRSQAQNAADAGALSGAYGLAFDTGTLAERQFSAGDAAWHTAHFHPVWTEHPAVTTATPYKTTTGFCNSTPEACIRVDVWRDGSNGGTALPTWFGQLFGQRSQRTKAMAVAETEPATGSNCLKPWLIPDRFQNNVGSPDNFDVGDVYIPPTKNEDGTINYGTGYTPEDIGTTLVLKPGKPNQAIAPGNFYAVDDPMFDINGGNDYRDAIAGCVLSHSVGDTISIKDGNMIGPTNQGFTDLLDANGGSAIVMIGMFNPAAYVQQSKQTGNQDITIVNMLAFKVTEDSFQGNTITGTIVGAPSSMLTPCTMPPCPTTTGLASILKLVR